MILKLIGRRSVTFLLKYYRTSFRFMPGDECRYDSIVGKGISTSWEYGVHQAICVADDYPDPNALNFPKVINYLCSLKPK